MAAITKNLFTQLQNDPNVDFLGMKDQVHVYAQARDIELKNRDEYLKRAEEAADPQVKTLFEQVCVCVCVCARARALIFGGSWR